MAREPIGHVVIEGARRPIEIDLDAGRLEVRAGGAAAFIRLYVQGTTMAMVHTEVPIALRGRGIAEAMARAGLIYAREQGFSVEPLCPFVARFIARHPEFQDVVAT